MPLTIEPPNKTHGRGSAPGTRRRRTRGRRPQLSTEALLITETGSNNPTISSQFFIGQELVDLQQPHAKQSETAKKHNIESRSSTKNTTKDAPMSAKFTAYGKKRSQHTLCLDTRFIDTKAGRDAGLEIVDGFQSFVKHLGARGDFCNIMATTTTRSERLEKHIVAFDTVRQSQVTKLSAPIQGVALRDSSSSTGNEVSLPDELSADNSWNLFTRMILSMLSEPEQRLEANHPSPLEFTILSSDMALFSDCSPTKHIDCFKSFLANIMADPQAHRISVIRLVVAETHMLAIRTNQAPTVEPSRDAYKVAVAQCTSAIKGIMDEIEINGTPASSQLVQYNLTLIDGSAPSYQALSCKMFRESLFTHDVRRQISFDLPETSDGIQCRIAFNVFFQTFPYKLGSREAESLVNDLHRLTSCTFEIIQLVPMPCVDASLLYGVPFAVNTVLEQNFDRNEETECLTTVFFRHLQEHDHAVLLKAFNSSGQSVIADQPEDVQYFLMMPQEFPEAMSTPPRSGLLFHYADENQLLSEAVQMKSNKNLESDLGLQYTEYIESAMSALECKPFNPLLGEIEIIPEESTASFCFDNDPQKEATDSNKKETYSFNHSSSQIPASDEECDQLCAVHAPEDIPSFEERSNNRKTNKRRQVKRAPFNSPPAMSQVIVSTDRMDDHSMQSSSTQSDSQQKHKNRSEDCDDKYDIENAASSSAFNYEL